MDIRTIIKVFFLAFMATFLFAGVTSGAYAQTCRWDGTAPYCAGECGPGETEEGRSDAAHKVQHLPSVNHFGNGCVFGTKAYCCKTPGITCRWDGTAPFCDGECKSDEETVKECSSCSGKVCWTGTKVKCCKAHTGSSSSPLTAPPSIEDARYAAIWEKKSGSPWVARHGMTSSQYQQEFNKYVGQGYRLTLVNGYGVGDKAYYTAIWEKRRDNAAWVARHGMSSAKYQEEFNKYAGQGYKLSHVSGYGVGDKAYYAAIWEKPANNVAWVARHGMTSAKYQEAFDQYVSEGYRLVHISGYGVGSTPYYAAIWEKRAGPAWVARHGMTSAQYQQEFNNFVGKGYRLTEVSGYTSSTGGKALYAAIWEKKAGPAWVARHGMTSQGYQEEFNDLVQDGFRLISVTGYYMN